MAVVFEWHGRHYETGEKGADWYWALGILAIAGMVAAILFSNILLALVIAAGAVTVILQALKRPRIHRFAVTEEGLQIDENMYRYDSMLDFSVLEYIDPTLPPSLSIKTRHLLAPHLLVPIIGPDPVEVYEYISDHLPEGNHHESVVDRIVEFMRL